MSRQYAAQTGGEHPPPDAEPVRLQVAVHRERAGRRRAARSAPCSVIAPEVDVVAGVHVGEERRRRCPAGRRRCVDQEELVEGRQLVEAEDAPWPPCGPDVEADVLALEHAVGGGEQPGPVASSSAELDTTTSCSAWVRRWPACGARSRRPDPAGRRTGRRRRDAKGDLGAGGGVGARLYRGVRGAEESARPGPGPAGPGRGAAARRGRARRGGPRCAPSRPGRGR